MIPDRLGYFLDDFGNFENLVKSWTVDILTITKIRQKLQETLWEHPGNILSL